MKLTSFRKYVVSYVGCIMTIKTKVKTQNPNTLEDAIKNTQIFNDNIDNKPS